MKRFIKFPSLVLVVLILFILIYAGWQWAANYRPVVQQVPVLTENNEIILLGRRFARSQNQGVITIQTESELPANATINTPLPVLSWSDSKIVAQIPDNIQRGTVQVTQSTPFGQRSSLSHAFVRQAAGLPSQPYGYQVPVQEDSPWPNFRRDQRNTGQSPLHADYSGDQPWLFKTGKGIFSTPVVDALGTVYVGSADHFFYAINPDGTLQWKFETGEIIDSAGALGRYDPQSNSVPITFISGDGFMYHFRTGGEFPLSEDRQIWKFQAELRPEVSYNRWFEGNVATGYDGTLYAGNTNFNYYAINPDGTLQWKYETGSNNWSQAAFGDDGTLYWGSNDTYIRGVAPNGKELWKKMTLGFIAASAAVGSDGTVYISSFDSNLYALDPISGKVKWKFPTQDHIYSSAALGADSQGNTNAIYIGSADGGLYAIRPNGSLIWAYDTGDPIRSSPVIGKAPQGEDETIVYFGGGNGKLYALNANDGSLRWSFDTTPDDPELRDRNDLNGSPALGKSGIYIGGEHGNLVYVPYDFCMHNNDSRCDNHGENELPRDITGLFYVTPGGTTETQFPATLPVSSNITLRLVVRENGKTIPARVCNSPFGCPKRALEVAASPSFPFKVEHSADGRFIYILPDGFFEPGQTYTLNVTGQYYNDGLRVGNLTLGGRKKGDFANTFIFKTDSKMATRSPLKVSKDRNSAFEWTRLAATLPPMLPSLNQIGFDYMDWIIGTIVAGESDEHQQGKLLVWAVGARRGANGNLVVDPATDYLLPLSGEYQNDSFRLANQKFNMPITGIKIPFNLFQIRGQFGQDLIVKPGATAYADTKALSIPTFGPYLVVAGLANNIYQKLLVSGTYITRPYPDDGTANQRPTGVQVEDLSYIIPTKSEDGLLEAKFHLDPGTSYPLDQHKASLLLVDEDRMEAIALDYHANLQAQAGADGNLQKVKLTIPKGTFLPDHIQAYVILDVFPVYQKTVTPTQ